MGWAGGQTGGLRGRYTFLCSVLLWVTTLLVASCTQPTIQPVVSPEKVTEEPPSPRSYPLAQEDVVEVIVWKNPDLSRVVTIRPDGKISLPLIGDVQAEGRTAMQLSEEIAERLKVYYQNPPQVSVIVAQINSYVIYILGAVRTPGKHIVKSETTFLQAIALAGDFTPFASLNKIMIRRKDDSGKDISIPMPYKDVLAGKLRDIILKPGDIIIVP